MKFAPKAGFLSFDSTQVSSSNVGFLIYVVLYKKDSFHMAEHRYEKNDFENISARWDEELQTALQHIPEEWMDVTFNKL
ncbi:MAG: hypothetical protein ABI863_23320 [Ginsengibacter sp.]